MGSFAERSGAKYGRTTAGVSRIYCVRRWRFSVATAEENQAQRPLEFA